MSKKNKSETIVEEAKVEKVKSKKELTPTEVKAKNLLNAAAKSVLGLYIIGLLLTLNELFITLIGPAMGALSNTGFMNAELVPLADFIAKPIRTMTWVLPMALPIVVLGFGSIYVLKKIKVFTEKELKVYTFVMTLISALVLL